MNQKRGFSNDKNLINSGASKLIILAILSIFMFAASVSYAVAAPVLVGSPDRMHTGVDAFYFSNGTSVNQTIVLRFNVTYTTAGGGLNASGVNVTVNCSGVGDTLTPLKNATVLSDVDSGSVQIVEYNATCNVVINGTASVINPFYQAYINITLRNNSANLLQTNAVGPLMIYNMTVPPLFSACQRWGVVTTDFSSISDFQAVNMSFQPVINMSCHMGRNWTEIAPGCPVAMCGWMNAFSPVNIINFQSINMTDPVVAAKLPQMMNAITVSVPPPDARYGAATTKVWVNSSFFEGLNTNASITLFKIPFRGRPDIVTESEFGTGSVNSTYVYLVASGDGMTYNMTFRVFHFSTYNATDVTAPIITSQYPVNSSIVSTPTPTLNFTLNGTGTEINLSALSVLISGTGIANISLTRLNFTCRNETTDGTIGSYMSCILGNQTAISNGTYNAKISIEDMGGDAGIKQNYTLTFGASTMLPTITFNSPIAGQYTNTSPVLNFTISLNSTLNIGGVHINLLNFSAVLIPNAIISTSSNLTLNGTNQSIYKWFALSNGAIQVVIMNYTLPQGNPLPNSSIVLNITARDNASNQATWTAITFFADDQIPIVTLGMPIWYNTSSSTPSLIFNSSDAVSQNLTCNLTIDGTVNTSNMFITNGSINSAANVTTTLSDGIHNWGINCWDIRLNLNSTTSVAAIAKNFTVDRTAPTVNHTASPLNNTYIGATLGVFKLNLSDSPRYGNNVSSVFAPTNTYVRCSYNGGVSYFTAGNKDYLNFTNVSTSDFFTVYGNCSDPNTPKMIFSDNDNITMTIYANDTVNNQLVYVLKWYIDTTAPTITSPKISKTSLTQGENLTVYVTITDPVSGVNTTNATINITGLYGASTNRSGLFRSLVLVSGNNYSIQINTTDLSQGNYSVMGELFATDFRADGTNENRTDLVSALLNFTLTSPTYGTPVIERVEINYTAFVLNRTVMLNISVNVTDSDNISQVWVMFTGNTGVANSSLKVPLAGVRAGTGGGTYRNMTYAFNVTGTSTADVTMTVYANDTLGNQQSVSRTLTVRQKAAEIDLLTINPSTPYRYQLPLNITARVFAFDGVTRLEVNITNVSLMTVSGAASGVLTNLTAYCDVVNATASLYVCYNITAGQSIATNTTGAHIIAASTFVSGSTTATNINTTYSVVASVNGTVGAVPSSVTLIFVESGITATTGTQTLLPSTPVTVSIRDSTAGITSSLQNVNFSLGAINFSVNLLNNSDLSGVSSANTTLLGNSSNIGGYIANSSAVVAVVAIEPVFNVSSVLGTSNNITIFCSELGIGNCSQMAIYKTSFNFTTNITGTTWSLLVPTYDGVNNSLTISVSSFSLFAVATPTACANSATVPATGCLHNGIIRTSGYICSNAWQSTVCPTTAAATTSSTSSSSSSDTPIGNVSAPTKSTYIVDSISAGVDKTITVNLKDVPLTGVVISTNQFAKNVELAIEKLSAAPTDAGNVPSTVYSYLSVTPKNLPAETITSVKMDFKVAKSWLTQNKLTESQIVLSRYNSGKWNELETTLLSSDDTTVYFRASSPGFSYFAVTIKEAKLVAPAEQTKLPTTPPEEEKKAEEKKVVEETKEQVSSKSWIAWLIVAIIVVAGAAGYFIYQKTSAKK